MEKQRVIQSEELHQAAADWLGQQTDLCEIDYDDAGFHAALHDAAGLVVRTYTRVDSRLLRAAPKLRCVARAGVGLDNIDLESCRARGVRVVYTPDANTQAVAEFVFALLADATRPRLFLDHALSTARWREVRRELTAPRQLNELSLGILGMGRVGSRVARIAQGFGMNVLYHDLREIPPAQRWGSCPTPLEALFENADVISVHIDARPGNRHFVAGPLLSKLRPEALLLNTSRGFVVDGIALADFLTNNPRAQALLDVHDPEPPPADAPLLALKNAHCTPHIAAATAVAHANMSWVVRDLVRVLRGEEPEHEAR